MQISTVVIANLHMLSSSFDDSLGDKSESTLIVAVGWQRWWVFLRTVNILLQLEYPLCISGGFRAGDELGFESWHGDATLLSRLLRDSSIACEKHMASLRLAVRTVIGPIGIRASYETNADVEADAEADADADADDDADANANANANDNAEADANANANANADAMTLEV